MTPRRQAVGPSECQLTGVENVIYRAINLWLDTRDKRKDRYVAVVLHTSVVQYPMESIHDMWDMPVKWILPDNVRWELKLLRQSRIFGRKAEQILKYVEAQEFLSGIGAPKRWDLEQLYEGCANPVDPAEIFSGSLLFAFGDLNKQDEFLANVRELEGHWVLLNTGWDKNDTAMVMSLSQMRGCRFRKVKPIEYGEQMPQLRRISGLECWDGRDKRSVVNGRDFVDTGHSGSYARIYSSQRFPGRYVKIFEKQTAVGNYVRKLANLTNLKRWLGPCTLALPEMLLMLDDRQMAGFSMMRFRGKSLQELLIPGWESRDHGAILRRLILMLLELQCLHILPGDLTLNNVMIDEDDRVYLVDCDSFQVLDYASGMFTDIFRHPQIDPDTVKETLRDPRHEYFAFAVLMFYYLYLCDPLLQRQSEGDERKRTWTEMEFPFDRNGQPGPNVNDQIRLLWEMQEPKINQMFAEEFHYLADHSLGAWIRVLELLD